MHRAPRETGRQLCILLRQVSRGAVNYTTFGYVSAEEWTGFCKHYGRDVTAWAGFEVLRDIRELRKVTFAVQMAKQRSDLAEQARYRLACIRGEHGSRPWGWTGVP